MREGEDEGSGAGEEEKEVFFSIFFLNYTADHYSVLLARLNQSCQEEERARGKLKESRLREQTENL